MPKLQPKWKFCRHEFPEAYATIREPMFNVAIGSMRICKLCQAIEYENWSETRASGGTPRIFPPEKKAKKK